MAASRFFTTFAVLTCLACSTPSYADGPTTAVTAADFRWEKKLGGPTRFELHNLNGGLKAEATSDDTLRVIAVKTGRREDVSRVRVVVREDAGRIVACALWPGQDSCPAGSTGHAGKDPIDVRVDFVVQVPAKIESVEAETLSGPLTVSHVRGRAHLHTMNGDIDVVAAGPIDAQTMNGNVLARVTAKEAPVHLASKNGRVELALPPDANADVEASTLRGTITSAFGAVPPPPFPGVPNKSRFRIGAGGVAVGLETLNGNVVVRRGT